jgi:ATP-binding cassette subfamily B protein
MTLADNPIVYLARVLWRFSEGNRKKVVLYLTLLVIANIIGLTSPLIVGYLLNTIQQEGLTNLPKLIAISLLFLVPPIGFWLFHGPARIIEVKNAFLARANFRKYLVDGIMALPIAWHTDHHSGDTIDKVEKATTGLHDFARTTFEVVETFVRFIGSFIALVYFNIHSSYIVLILIILSLLISRKFDSVLIPRWKKLFGAENKIAEKVYDAVSNITTIVILKIEKLISKEIWKKIMTPFSLESSTIKINEGKWFCVSVMNALIVVAVIISYIYFIAEAGEVVMVGTLYILYGYVERINNVVFRFAYKYTNLVRYKTKVENADPVINQFRKRKLVKQHSMQKWKKLKVNELSFSYHDDENHELHLNNLSLEILKGEKIALVGESGSGKTTFLKLIRGLYEPRSLELFIDGKKLDEGFNAIESKISLIPQEPEIFATTIKENITLGVNHSMKKIKECVSLATFTKVVNRLPNKYNSSIMEKGVNLSGGEKQRLALARGILASKDKEMILFDEPTSSVDTENELKIYKGLFAKHKNKTIISSIHRLHLLNLFDRVFYFKKGKLLAQGTFEELLKESKQFKSVWDKYVKEHKSNFKDNL